MTKQRQHNKGPASPGPLGLHSLILSTPADSQVEKLKLHREVIRRLDARARREMRTRHNLLVYILTAEAMREVPNDGGEEFGQAMAEMVARPIAGVRLTEEQARAVGEAVGRELALAIRRAAADGI